MRLSAVFAPTLRDDPAEAEIASHRLLLRAAFVRQVAAGVYTTLPLGLRSIRKIERIVREEMDASGAQEFRMPILLPAEPWKATGRWDLYGDTLFRLRIATSARCCSAPRRRRSWPSSRPGTSRRTGTCP